MTELKDHPVSILIAVSFAVSFALIILVKLLHLTLFFLMPKPAFEEMKRQYRRWRPSTKSFESEYLFYKSSTKGNFIYLGLMFLRFCYAVSGQRKIHHNLFGGYDFKPLLPRAYLFFVRMMVVFIVLAFLGIVLAILGLAYLQYMGVLDEKYYLFRW